MQYIENSSEEKQISKEDKKISLASTENDESRYPFAVERGNIYFDKTTGIIIDCDNTVTATNIPNVIDNVNVVGIGEYAFSNCSNLTSITIPDSVTTIEEAAFLNCNGLTSITMSNGVTSIGDEAFNGCSNLTSITIPDSVTSIGRYAFSNCSNLTSIAIPDSMTSIGDGAFADCNGLTSITIPDSVTSIGDEAFYMCDNLKIYCYAESEAEKYAKENNIPYEIIAGGIGDVDGYFQRHCCNT